MRAFGVLLGAALLYLGLATALPTSVRSLGSHPKAARDYATAMQLAKAFRRADAAAAAGGESIILVHGMRTPRAIVLFHGLTNSPRQFRELAAALYDGGANVFVPRLPQQALRGADADDLGRMTAEALRDVGDASIDLASGLGDTVIVLGLSLGGDVAAWTAQFRPEVYRAVIVAPTLGLAHVPSIAATPMMNLILRVPNYSKHDPPNRLRPDRTLGWSTRAVGQMIRLGAAVRRAADKRAPAARDIRVLVNANDRTVSRDAIDELAAQWSATGGRVSMFEFPGSFRLPHDVIDPDKVTGNTSVAYPVLLALLYGSTPPANLARRLRRVTDEWLAQSSCTMSPSSASSDHQIRTIAVDGEKYLVSLRVGYDGVEHVGRLMFTEASTEIFYQDHGGVPGTSVQDAVGKAKDFSEGEMVQRCYRALSEKRRFGKLRRATDKMLEKIKYLNRIAIGLEKGFLEPESGKLQLDQAQSELLDIVRSLRVHAGVEDEPD